MSELSFSIALRVLAVFLRTEILCRRCPVYVCAYRCIKGLRSKELQGMWHSCPTTCSEAVDMSGKRELITPVCLQRVACGSRCGSGSLETHR